MALALDVSRLQRVAVVHFFHQCVLDPTVIFPLV